jgi:hypothetical protein
MRRIWEGTGTGAADKSAVRSEEVCAVVPEDERNGGLKASRGNAAGLGRSWASEYRGTV